MNARASVSALRAAPGSAVELYAKPSPDYVTKLAHARLVLRVIREAAAAGAAALNYARVENLLRDRTGRVRGVALRDTACAPGRTAEVKAKVVVNAGGPWVAEALERLELSWPPADFDVEAEKKRLESA